MTTPDLTTTAGIAAARAEAKRRLRTSMKTYHNAEENWSCENVNYADTTKPFLSYLDWIHQGIDAVGDAALSEIERLRGLVEKLPDLLDKAERVNSILHRTWSGLVIDTDAEVKKAGYELQQAIEAARSKA